MMKLKSKSKYLCTLYPFLLTSFLLLLLTGCAANEIVAEDLTGVWRTRGFEENASASFPDTYSAIYITEDGNLYVLTTFDTTAFHVTDIYRFYYEIIDGQLMLTPIEEGGDRFHERLEEVEISMRGNRIQLDMRVTWPAGRSSFQQSFTYYKFSDEVPYGWSNADRQEIQEVNEMINEKIVSFAEQFGEALGYPISLYDGYAWSLSYAWDRYWNVMPFVVEDVLFEIAFNGEAPTPTRPQRHTHVPDPAFLIMLWEEVKSLDGRFVLIYDGFGTTVHDWRDRVPQEWLEIFASLGD